MKQLIEPFGDGTVTLRLMEERDLTTILDWRNRDEARVWFKTSAKLSFESHKNWYDHYRNKNNDFFFLVEARAEPVGQCAIYDIDLDAGSAEIGRFLAAPNMDGHGYMTRCCSELVRFGTGTLNLPYLFLEVMEQNEKAIKLYKRCGFKEERRSGGLIRMGLRRGDLR